MLHPHRALSAVVLLLLAAPLAPVAAQDGDEWRTRTDAVLDRWADDKGGSRVARAAEIVAGRLRRQPKDIEARLELARLELAAKNYGAAMRAADECRQLIARRAEGGGQVSITTERRRWLRASVLAYYSAHFRMTELLAGEQEAEKGRALLQQLGPQVSERRADLFELAERLYAPDPADATKPPEDEGEGQDEGDGEGKAADEATPTPPSGREITLSILKEEADRRRYLLQLDRLGRRPPKLKDLKPDDFPGRVVLVVFWASKLPGLEANSPDLAECRAVLEQVKALEAELRERLFKVVAVNLDGDEASFQDALDALGVKDAWSHVYLGDRPWSSETVRAWRVQRLPCGALLDHRGRIRFLDPWGPNLRLAVEELLRRRDN